MPGKSVRLISVFVSSPGDVAAERAVLDEVVNSINRTDGVANGFRLELFRWEDDVASQIGPKPQPVVDSQTPQYDVYVGIMSTRFGAGGTGKEFRAALQSWKDSGSPWIAFYFDAAPRLTGDLEQAEQFAKVCKFRSQMQRKGIVGTYKGVRGSGEAFYETLSDHLRQIVQRITTLAADAKSESAGARPSSTPSSLELWREKLESYQRDEAIDADPPRRFQLRKLIEEARQRISELEQQQPTRPHVPTVPGAYIRWLLSRCGEVELMGMELQHGSKIRLDHVYTPLATTARSGEAQTGKRRRIRELPPTELPPGELSPGELSPAEAETRQLLLNLLNGESLYVSGAPGSGKSTFCRWVTWLTCYGELPEVDVPAPEGYGEAFPDQLKGRLPVLVPLRDFWKHLPSERIQSLGFADLETALEQWLAAQSLPGLDWPCLKANLDHGTALLMLDGVDEVPPSRSSRGEQWYPRQMLVAGLTEAVARWTESGNRILVTSRPYGLEPEQQRKLGLLDAPILSLDEELQGLLVRRWFIRLKESRELGLETAEAMLDHIRVERGLHELAINPLLLTAMCIIYDEGKRLPHDKYLLYNRIVGTVLHKRYSGKESIETIRGRLTAVALGMHTGEGLGQQREAPEASASVREVDATLQTYQQLDGSTDQGLKDTVRAREDLLSQSGLLISRGDGSASFYHLSIQEFLAAERLFILHGQRPDKLVEVFAERGRIAGWRNTLGLLFGDLVDTFRPHSGVECLRELAGRIQLAACDASRRGQPGGVWNQAIVVGDCLQVLVGRESGIPDDLRAFFQKCVDAAVQQEIAIKDRQTLAVTLGRLGDSRIETDLRIRGCEEVHPGYVCVPEGPYVVGENRRMVKIDRPFWLSKYPVTNSQFELFIEDGGYLRREFWSEGGWQWREKEGVAFPRFWRAQNFNAPNQPVVGVTWWEAETFCKWAGGQLPSEEQWEAAARGPKGFEYPWGDDWEDGICNSNEAKLGVTSAVGIFPRSRSAAFGLEDMAGNVWEWCSDQRSPKASDRVIRGGCWLLDARHCRAAFRGGDEPRHRNQSLGFRVAAVPLGEAGKQEE